MRQCLDAQALARRQFIVGETPPLLHAGQVQVHVDLRYRGCRAQPRLEDFLPVVADLLAQDRLAVFEDDDEPLAAELFELLRQ